MKMPPKILIFSRNSNEISPCGAYTGPCRPNLFLMWPARQKVLPNPELELRLSLKYNTYIPFIPVSKATEHLCIATKI